MQFKAVLVDDELPSLQNLEFKIKEFCPDVKIVASFQRPEDAILHLNIHKPDILFLDIEMPRINGFSLLEQFPGHTFEVIFTTAYDQYAIEAVRKSAFDYLVKPVNVTELQKTVARLTQKATSNTPSRAEFFPEGFREGRSAEGKISINSADGIDFYKIGDIIYIESSSNYCRLYLSNGQKILATKLLKEFEELLARHGFFRIHHSYLINLNHLKKYIRGDGGQVVMSDSTILDVSRRKKEEFMKLLN
jgi:two-component system LytT family response regulator